MSAILCLLGEDGPVLIVIEGVDGAGKRTLTHGMRTALQSVGKSVATLAFPRYRRSVTADIAAEALHGEHGDLASSVYAMALLFALDRAAAADEIAGLRRDHDAVILDRYVASNAAYSAARLHQDAGGAVAAWVHRLEYERLALPAPAWQVLLDVSAGLAADRARNRERENAQRTRDAYERDDALQRRTATVYRDLAERGFGGHWQVVGPGVDAAALMARLDPSLGQEHETRA